MGVYMPSLTDNKRKGEFGYMGRSDKESWDGVKQDAWTEDLCETSQYKKYSHNEQAWSTTKSKKKKVWNESMK